jgi:sugar phosphate isomerase/epimerase
MYQPISFSKQLYYSLKSLLCNTILKMSLRITRSSLNTIPTAFATVSLGTPSSTLEDKVAAISSSWFQAIELGFPDLLSFASKYHDRPVSDSDYPALCEAATEVRILCKHYNLRIMMLQPFSNFEGWPRGSKERNKAFARARGWVKIMAALGTDMLQVGSSDSEGITGDVNELAEDLGELADILAEKGFKIAYENWCWATHTVCLSYSSPLALGALYSSTSLSQRSPMNLK